VKEHGIIFSGPMVRAILEGRKTQTRRIVKFSKPFTNSSSWSYVYKSKDGGFAWTDVDETCLNHNGMFEVIISRPGKQCPYGTIGDRIWVKENFWMDQSGGVWIYKAGTLNVSDPDWPPTNCGGTSVPSIFMPRWASRITLEITNIRVQRLQEITEEDIKAEGLSHLNKLGYHYAFGQGWNHLNEKRGFRWDSNPWVWAISFKRISP
jgi:hypothetical protein